MKRPQTAEARRTPVQAPVRKFPGLAPAMGHAAELIWDFLRLIDEKGREDKIFTLAGGVAFNLMLAFIPLLVLTVSATAFFLGHPDTVSVSHIVGLLANVVPVSPEGELVLRDELLKLLTDVLSNVVTTASIGTIAFIWLTTRLFGSLRVVLADVFDIEETRNPIKAKLFDMRISLVSSLFLMSYFAITAYLAIAVEGQLVGGLEYYLFTLLAYVFILITFLLLYRYLPQKRVRWRTALVAALFTSVMFETARYVFGMISAVVNPGSMYSGLIAALIVAVVWSYYVALIFILGGEVAQVYDLLRMRKIQRVVFG